MDGMARQSLKRTGRQNWLRKLSDAPELFHEVISTTHDKPNDDSHDATDDEFATVIHRYTTEQAVGDGVLVHTGNVGPHDVYLTRTLWERGYRDIQRQAELVYRGLALLLDADPEDSPYMRLRVIEEGELWVIAEPGKITYLAPEDY